ncbi:flippase-like domain-containing protein [Candidatus Nitrosopelagicus sp.]|nr:flippase-like domain-containing protein [Candidatus Nitrosopelagicus sp.]
MKFDNRFYFILVGAIVIYITFLIVSDLNIILDKILDMKTEFLPYILSLAPLSWFILFMRWHLLLKNSNIDIPKKENFKIYMTGFAMSATPGKIGELIKAHMLHSKFEIPKKNTIPIIVSEQFYNIIGILVVSVLGLFYFDFSIYAVALTGSLFVIMYILLSSEKSFKKFMNFVSQKKFLKKYVPSLSDSYLILKKSIDKKIFIISSFLSVIFWLIESVIAYLVLLSFNVDSLEFLQLAATYTTSIIIGVVSFLPMGIGVVEGSLAGFFSYQNIELSLALTLVIFIRIFTRWYGVIIGFIFMKLIGGFSLNTSNND